MGGPIALDAIAQSILGGAEAAFSTYQQMSGGHWLDVAPESFIQTSVALSLSQLQGVSERLYVTLEASPSRILHDCEIKIDKRRIKMRSHQKFDVMIWWKNGSPRAAVEIKKCWHFSQCVNDLARMRQWLTGVSPVLQAAYMVVYSSAKGKKAQETLDGRFSAIAEAGQASNWISLRRGNATDDGWLWDAACIILRP